MPWTPRRAGQGPLDRPGKKREVRVDTGSFSAGVIIGFQHLVLALGAEIDLSRVPGMPEHAFVMQNVGDAMILRSTLIARLEEANATTHSEVRRRLLTFVVVGGGYSGVETAGEMLDLLREAARDYPDIPPEEIRVVLVHSRERISRPSGRNWATTPRRNSASGDSRSG